MSQFIPMSQAVPSASRAATRLPSGLRQADMAKPAAGSGAISLAMILPPLSAMPQPKGMKRPTGQFSPQTSIHLLNTNQSGQNAPLDDPGFSIGAHRAVNLRQAHIFTPQTPLQPAFPPAKAQEPRQS